MPASAILDFTPLPVTFRPLVPMDSNQFFDFCQINRELMMEQSANGEVLVLSRSGGNHGAQNAELTRHLCNWSGRNNNESTAFCYATGFTLPNNATCAPDGAWVLRSGLSVLPPAKKQKFLPLCPDFVVGLRSATDRLAVLKGKIREYVANGARLGWLIDPMERRVYVYTQTSPAPIVLENARRKYRAIPTFCLTLILI